jgi:hypothetical protein
MPQMTNQKAFRITLTLSSPQPRLDTVLLAEIRAQDRNLELKRISRTAYKKLFDEKRITIKGQNARPSSGLHTGTTDVDILGFEG